MSQETVNPTPSTTEKQAPASGTTDEQTLLGPEQETSQEVVADGEEPKETSGSDVPEKYEFKLPEGMELDAGTLDVFTPIFKQLGLNAEGAQSLVDAYIPIAKQLEEKVRQNSMNDFKSIVDGWMKETKAELGPTLKEDLAACGRALNKFGTVKLRELMQETGVGNHPEMVKFIRNIGKTISEDSVVDPKEQPHNLISADPRKMYPTMAQ